MRIRVLEELERAEHVLICGAGGGFDVFCGLPIYHALKKAGKRVDLASLSSGALAFTDASNPAPGLWEVTATTAAPKYFPEMHLAGWLSQRFPDTTIYCIAPSGARQTTAAYQSLIEKLRPDALVLVDGGTDSLMRGDEAGLATPEGDALSLLAAHSLPAELPNYILCLGFGIDAHHGVCHAHFLENVAALAREDAFLGAWSLLADSEEFEFYREGCEFAFGRLPEQVSIVNSSIIAAVLGDFGNVHKSQRTEGSELFINPLMALYWGFRLENVARRNLYLDLIRETDSFEEVSLIIERLRDSLPSIRPWTTIPC